MNSILPVLSHARITQMAAFHMVFAILSVELCYLILLKTTLVRGKIRENFLCAHSRNHV